MFHSNLHSALLGAVVFALLSPPALRQASSELPVRLASRSAAEKAGCRFAHIKGPSIDSCILTIFHDNQMDLAIYEPSRDGVYTRAHFLELSSWYWDAKLSFVDALNSGTDWIAISTEGMRGTGIHHRILLVIGWDGARFRTLASETLDYGCFRPTSPDDFKLEVRYAFETLSGRPGIRINYELIKNEARIGAWSDQLRYNPSTFAFVPFKDSVEQSNLLVDRIREQIRRTRVYATSQQMNPADNLARQTDWLNNSGLLEVMDPACVGMTLVTGPREFAGKWGLDRQRSPEMRAQGALPVPEALVVSWDKTALTIGESSGRDGMGKPYSLSLAGRETTVPVGSAVGKAKAEWIRDQLVVTITTADGKSPTVRRYYREEQYLIVESPDASGRSIRAFYQKS